MLNKKTIGLCLIACMLLSNSVYAAEVNNKSENIKMTPISTKISEEQKVSVIIGKEIISEDKLVKYNVKIPKIQGLKDTKYEEQLNDIIMRHAEKDIESIRKQAEEFAQNAQKEGWPIHPMELFIDYDIKSNKEILSLVITTCAFTGGTSMPRIDCYNIDTKQNKRVELRDLFKENSDYKSIINQENLQQINEQKQKENVLYFEGEYGFKTISDYQNFYISGDNLVIVFDKYSIAPGCAGEPKFNIPMSYLNDILKNQQILIVDGIYYNYKYDFKFKIPPVWNGKVNIVENYGKDKTKVKVDFIYVPQDSKIKSEMLASISVINKESYDDKGSDKNASNMNYKIAEKKGFVYEISIPKLNPYNKESKEYKEYSILYGALDGIDDLFKNADVKHELQDKFGKGFADITVFDKININNKEASLKNSIYKNKYGVVMIPLQEVSEQLGYKVTLNNEKQSAELIKGVQWTMVKVGEDNYSFAKMLVKLGTAPEIKNSCIYVPLDFVNKILKANVMINEDGMITIL